MFSIEAIASMALVILALGIFAYSSTIVPVEAKNMLIQSQAQAKMIVYFKIPFSTANPDVKEQYCEKAVTYVYATKTLLDNNACWWSQ